MCGSGFQMRIWVQEAPEYRSNDPDPQHWLQLFINNRKAVKPPHLVKFGYGTSPKKPTLS